MGALGLAVLVVFAGALALAALILWDRLVGTALIGVAAGATWVVAQSQGRWWFWPVVVVTAVVLVSAFVTAVVIS
jgi:hypothetical protein